MQIRAYVARDDEAQVIALWQSVFGYAEARNDPAFVLATKAAWDAGTAAGALLLVAVESPAEATARSDAPGAPPSDEARAAAPRDGACALGPSPAPSDAARAPATPRVLGTLMLGYDGHRGWLYRLAVAEPARRRGVARALVRSGERRLAELGCAKINLQVHTHNDAAARFWRAMGYMDEPRLCFGKDLGRSADTDARSRTER